MARIRRRTLCDESEQEKVEKHVYKVTYYRGAVRYKVIKSFRSKGLNKIYNKQFSTLKEARAFLCEVVLEFCKTKKWKNYVYFWQDLNTGHIKIGKATHPTKRLCCYKSTVGTHFRLYGYKEPNIVMLGYVPQRVNCNETYLHAVFNPYRVDNEWFDGSIKDQVLKLLVARRLDNS